ncbi:metallophosphoesterase family protein [Virgibacillus sp. NKC19-16]|uniref:metallophosphoesterase family protein n=1 Tax=Virgibacillus salidurans TaxID=2831673 RepID=UPI001F442DB2|nr:metallophosphoesterase family protein [Virgibacillus sp. NKC19-16]UJL47249.1 metallophosphoesterase family protein [Virgibacillus sp. NKC19-16]
MKIVIIADTHMPDKGKQLPSRLKKELETTNLIIHAGDWNSMEVHHMLRTYAEVKGVYGNVDSKDIKEHFPAQEILEVHGHKIGVIHGHGDKKTTEKRALEVFEGEEVDIIIFGHSHIPLLRYFKKKLLVNPGSPTDKRKLPYYSFAILTVGEEIRAEHVFFRDKS